MNVIKIRTSDKWFSLCVRMRSRWHCQRCGKFIHEDRRMALHCSHFHGRGKWGTRFDPVNCEALCYGCHSFLGGQPEFHTQEKIKRIGQEEYDKLLVRSVSTYLGRIAKRRESEISKHYREQSKIMQELLDNSSTYETSLIDFEPFNLETL